MTAYINPLIDVNSHTEERHPNWLAEVQKKLPRMQVNIEIFTIT